MTSAGSSSLVWQALECLAGIDWTALFFWCLITFSLCLVSILLVSIFLPVSVKEDESMPSASLGRPPQGLDVFQQLFSQKLLPINSRTGWQLTGVHHELRSWEKKLELGGSCFSLHGSCAVMPSHSQGILETLKDINTFPEWDNQVTGCSYISVPTTTGDSDAPLMADVVSLTLTHQRSLLGAMLDRILAALAVPFNVISRGAVDLTNANTQKAAVVARTWRMEEDMSSWMFSRAIFKGKGHTLDELWSYTLAQPAENDPNKSIMHHITCTTTSRSDSLLSDKPALRLAALKQYFELKELKVRPLRHASLLHLTNHAKHAGAKGHAKGPCSPKRSISYPVGDGHPSRDGDAHVLPMFSTKDLVNLAGGEDQLIQQLTPTRSNGARKPRAASLGINSSLLDNSSSDDAGFYSERREVPLRNRKQRVKKTLSADVGEGGGREKAAPGQTMSLDRKTAEKGLGEFQDSDVIDILVDYQTIADQGVELVLEETMKAASINVNAPEDDQRQQTGGWSFHCLEKDVVILKKPKKGTYYSFLGKGIIKASPETVFKAIRNPRTRFTYDTMLKKMNITRNLSDDLCIYRMVHEVPQLLKKESRDFCVLQFCKTEGQRHVVAFQSVDWRECPESESMSRGHILPSGWVIEPVGHKQNQYSMVTYVVQVALCGKEVPASLNQFLSIRVPLSVAYLRLFLEAQLP